MRVRVLTRAALMLVLVAVAQIGASSAAAQFDSEFAGLRASDRVYSGGSLTPSQAADLRQRLEALRVTGADAIVYVRAQNSSPEETLKQVEALQQAWVRLSGADQDTAIAVLINRNPRDATDARAGIFVGSAYDDGNVPEKEQRAIVDDALIPPLRDGDVHASLVAGLERLASSIRNGPPRSAFERWSSDATSGWMPWTSLGLGLIGLLVAIRLFGRRQTIDLPEQSPTTTRPGDLSPALAGALARGDPQASAVQATLLDLAGRGALAIEAESDGGRFGQPTIQVRLVDRALLRGEVETAVWADLDDRAAGDLVSSEELKKLAASNKAVREAVRDELRAQDWLDDSAKTPRAGLGLTGLLVVVVAGFGLVVTAVAGDAWPMVPVIVVLGLLGPGILVSLGSYSQLSPAGQEVALAWRAYRDGLEQAAKDDAIDLDLDAVLPDIAAYSLGAAMKDRLKAATESGQTLRAFAAGAESGNTALPGSFPWWTAFDGSTASSGGGSGTVSGGGTGGGGGAAGST